jgi:pimeloyl-ACP methyl ester carboxylesterase
VRHVIHGSDAGITTVVLASMLLGACAASPPKVDQYTVDLPQGVTDARGRFDDIFCAVLREHGALAPDNRPCVQALSPVVGSPAGTGQPVDLGMSQRGLVAAVVPGIGWACFAEWLSPKGTAASHVRQYGYDQTLIEVDALSSSTSAAENIRDAIMAEPAGTGPPRIVLVGYSKGAPDILEAVVRYPEIRARVAAVVSVAGAIGGSALADDAEQWQADFLRHWPGAKCDKSDEGGVNSLRPGVRKRWLADNPLPSDVRYYSVVTLPMPDHVSRILGSSYRKLGKIDWRNDSQVIYSDEIVPGSTLLAFLNADHWAVATPVNRSHPTIASTFVTQNAYPREALLEAILRFVEEDLGRQ